MLSKYEIEQSLEKYQTSITKIQEYLEWQNGCLNKIVVQLNSQIEALQYELSQLKEPKTDNLVKSDIPVLYQNLNEQNPQQLEQISENKQEKMKEFFIQIEKQFQNMISEEKISQILNHFNQIINEKEAKKEQIEQKVEKCFNSTKTPFLQHLCSKHGKEIIMFVINEEYEKEKLVCVDCIPNITTKLTTLEDANKMWFTHQGECQMVGKKYKKKHNLLFLNIKKKLEQYGKKLCKILTSKIKISKIKQQIQSKQQSIASIILILVYMLSYQSSLQFLNIKTSQLVLMEKQRNQHLVAGNYVLVINQYLNMVQLQLISKLNNYFL